MGPANACVACVSLCEWNSGDRENSVLCGDGRQDSRNVFKMADKEEPNTFCTRKLTRGNYNYAGWKATIKTEMLRLECFEAIIGYSDLPDYNRTVADIRTRRLYSSELK